MKTLVKVALLGAVTILGGSVAKAEFDVWTIVTEAAPAMGDFFVVKGIIEKDWDATVFPMIQQLIPPAREVIRIVNEASDNPVAFKAEWNNLRKSLNTILNILSQPGNMALFIAIANKINESASLKELLVKHLAPLGITNELVSSASTRIATVLKNINKTVDLIMIYANESLMDSAK